MIVHHYNIKHLCAKPPNFEFLCYYKSMSVYLYRLRNSVYSHDLYRRTGVTLSPMMPIVLDVIAKPCTNCAHRTR